MTHQAFQPEDFGFKKLSLSNKSLHFFERDTGQFPIGKVNPRRLNIYLSQDGEYVTIWEGLFDPILLDAEILGTVPEELHDIFSSYNTQIYRGYISDAQTAQTILSSLRYEQYSASELHINAEHGLSCDLITGNSPKA